ncbi:MAG: hypothetical protein QXE05_00300 [Nitrososphaeria archaeon]
MSQPTIVNLLEREKIKDYEIVPTASKNKSQCHQCHKTIPPCQEYHKLQIYTPEEIYIEFNVCNECLPKVKEVLDDMMKSKI